MGLIIVLLALVMGCSDDGTTHTETYPADAGPDVEIVYVDAGHDAEDAGKNCIPIGWHFGPDRFCEQCICPGTPCTMASLGAEKSTGVCGDDLKCSVECTDPLWKEAMP